MRFIPWLVAGLLSSPIAYAQECTDGWRAFLQTDPLQPKVISGDTNAAYAIYSFRGDPSVRLELRGKFPKARFMSYETHDTRLTINEDLLIDANISPEPGSYNPFREGVAMDVLARDYQVHMAQTNPNGVLKNFIRLPSGRRIQGLILRYYSPSQGVQFTRTDLPRIFAVNASTGVETACPQVAPYPTRWHFPQVMANVYGRRRPFDFVKAEKFIGANFAASYMYAVTLVDEDEVAIFKFKPPTFTDTQDSAKVFQDDGQVRYWSFCTNNFPNNETYNCLPDYRARIHEDGFVYVAVGLGQHVEREAMLRGYAFLPDGRYRRMQRALGFVYRNLVPSRGFTQIYQGDYAPQGKVCDKTSFLDHSCGW